MCNCFGSPIFCIKRFSSQNNQHPMLQQQVFHLLADCLWQFRCSKNAFIGQVRSPLKRCPPSCNRPFVGANHRGLRVAQWLRGNDRARGDNLSVETTAPICGCRRALGVYVVGCHLAHPMAVERKKKSVARREMDLGGAQHVVCRCAGSHSVDVKRAPQFFHQGPPIRETRWKLLLGCLEPALHVSSFIQEVAKKTAPVG